MNFEQVTSYLEEKFDIVLDWGSETVLPMLKELAHRIATYNIIKDSITVFICLVIIVIAVIFFAKEIKAYIAEDEKSWFIDAVYDNFSPDLSSIAIVFSVVLGIFALFSIACFFVFIPDLMRWIFIPEIQLFDYIKGLMV